MALLNPGRDEGSIRMIDMKKACGLMVWVPLLKIWGEITVAQW